MKKLFFAITLMLGFLGSAQENTSTSTTSSGKNDLLINPIALVMGVGNIEYERIVSENSGVGVITTFIIDDYIIDTNNAGFFQLSPYYNYYFGKKQASGFYIGGFASIASAKVSTYNFNNNTTTYNRESRFGIGFKFGGKWVLKNNIVIEAGTGLGRNFNGEGAAITTTGMLGIGKRF